MSDLFFPGSILVIPKYYTPKNMTRYEKQVLHTTESQNYNPSTDSYYGHQLWPHATLANRDGWSIYSHLPLNKVSPCMRNVAGGVETNTDGCVQIEIAWVAAEGPNFPTGGLDKLYEWLTWVESKTGIPNVFVDDFHYYPPEDGHRLGKEPWRLRGEAWNNFRGILGHQHADENVHGDPGKINIPYLRNKHLQGGDHEMTAAELATAIKENHSGLKDILMGLIKTQVDDSISKLAVPATANQTEVQLRDDFKAIIDKLDSMSAPPGSSLSDADIDRIVDEVVARLAN